MKAKHLLLALLACCAFVGCEDEEGNKVDLASQRVYITGVDNNTPTSTNKKAAASGRRLTAHEICVTDSVTLWCISKDEYGDDEYVAIRFFINPESAGSGSIDTVQNRLGMRATEVLDSESRGGDILTSALYNRERYYITQAINNENGEPIANDTVAYVPRAQVNATFEEIAKLYNDVEGNKARILELYQDGFIFIPCTGEEYAELLKQGKQ